MSVAHIAPIKGGKYGKSQKSSWNFAHVKPVILVDLFLKILRIFYPGTLTMRIPSTLHNKYIKKYYNCPENKTHHKASGKTSCTGYIHHNCQHYSRKNKKWNFFNDSLLCRKNFDIFTIGI